MLILYLFFMIALCVMQFACGVSFVLGLGMVLCLRSDHYSFIFSFTLATISFCVCCWSYYYCDSEVMYRSLICLIFSFVLSIFLFVYSSNLLMLLVAWDLLGFSSLFLVLKYRSRAAVAGGLLTGLTNRLGDCFLLVLFGASVLSDGFVVSVFLNLVLLASITKSAQLPFSAWLPAAMAAPTPVSALVHSSTLVTAGVYFLFRFMVLPNGLVFSIGLLTTVIGGLSALIEADVKKLVALSTMAHLGLIVTRLGLGCRKLAFYHLVFHANFKALIFLVVGTMIHLNYGSQELRASTLLRQSGCFLRVTLRIALLSICGFLILSGWVSKEAILLSCFNSNCSFFALLCLYTAALLTLLYSLRLFYFRCGSTVCHNPIVTVAPARYLIKMPLLVLVSLSIMLGWSLRPTRLDTIIRISSWDLLLLWWFFLAGGLYYYFVLVRAAGNGVLWSYLVSTTTSFNICGPTISTFSSTEVNSLQALGLGRLAASGQVWSRGVVSWALPGVMFAILFAI